MKASEFSFTPLNLILLLVGIIVTATALFRMVPLKFDGRFWWSNGPLILMLLGAMYLVYRANDPQHFVGAGKAIVITTSRMFPMLILLFAVMGTSGVVTHLYYKSIETGFSKYPLMTAFGSGFIISTPNSVNPMIDQLWKADNLRTALMYFSLTTTMLSFCLLQLRIAGFSPNSPIPIQIYCTGIVMAVFMIPLMKPAMVCGDILMGAWHRCSP